MKVHKIIELLDSADELQLTRFFDIYLDFLAHENLMSGPKSLIMFEAYLLQIDSKKIPILNYNPTGNFSLVIPEPFGVPTGIVVDFF